MLFAFVQISRQFLYAFTASSSFVLSAEARIKLSTNVSKHLDLQRLKSFSQSVSTGSAIALQRKNRNSKGTPTDFSPLWGRHEWNPPPQAIYADSAHS